MGDRIRKGGGVVAPRSIYHREASILISSKSRRVAFSIAPGVFLAGIGGGIIFPILPLVGIRQGLSPLLIGLILAGNRMTRVLFNPLVGAMVDRYGGKRLLSLGLLVEAMVMALYWFGLRSHWVGGSFLLGRLVWGPASGLILIGGQTLAINASQSENRGAVAGIVRAAQSLGTPSGMALGGILAGLYGDGSAFLVGMGAALVASVVAWHLVPDIRVRGLPPRKWREVLGALRDRKVDAVVALNFVSFAAVQGLLLSTLVLMLAHRHLTVGHLQVQTLAGLLLALLLAAGALTTPWAGKWADGRHGRALVSTVGLTIMVPGYLALALAHGSALLVAGLVLVGIGMGALNVPLLALLGDVVKPNRRGSAVGSFQLMGDLGGTIGPLLGTSFVAWWGVERPYLGMTILLVLAIPVAIWLVRHEEPIRRRV